MADGSRAGDEGLSRPPLPEPAGEPGRLDVVLPGPYFCDLIFTGLAELPAPGAEVFGQGFDLVPGGCFHPVHALTRLGVRTGWACDYGSDPVSRLVLEAVRERGVEDRLFRHLGQRLCNVSASLSLATDRAFVTHADAAPPRSYARLLADERPRCLLLPGLYLRHRSWWLVEAADDPDLVSAARDVGAAVFMDCQHVDVTLADELVRQAISSVDVFSPNDVEAMRLTGAATVEDAVAELAAMVPTVVVKCGDRGAIARSGATTVSMPALDVAFIDSTAAGDCFDAGFVCAYLAGRPLDVCLALACICGSLAVTAPGSEASPTLAEAEALLAVQRGREPLPGSATK
jgi:sugar/nucleoside kinase (ribokinase family)